MVQNYLDKLQDWYAQQKASGQVLDLKFFPGMGEGGSIENTAKVIYETLIGVIPAEPLDTKNL